MATNSKPLVLNTFHYLEAGVRRNGRKEVREVTLSRFQEEGSKLSQLGVYKKIFLGNFMQPKLWPKFQVDLPISWDREPRSTRGNLLAHCFHFVSACLWHASTQHVDQIISPNPPGKHLRFRLPIGD